MKKFLALLLCLTMLLCIVPLGIYAEDDATTETESSATAVSDLAGLQAITGDGDYYLTNDIYVDLSTATLPLIADSFSGNLDGKGFSILFKNADGTVANATSGAATNEVTFSESAKGVVFNTCKAKSLKNLTVGSADAPAEVSVARTAGSNNGVLANSFNASGVRPLYENITVYGNIYRTADSQNTNVGIFFAEGFNNVYFVNCKAVGEIHMLSGNYNVGGFVGIYRPTSKSALGIRLVNCISDVTFHESTGATRGKTSGISPFVGTLGKSGYLHNNIFAHNCLSVNELPALNGKIGLINGYQLPDSTGTVTVNNCATLGTLEDALELTTDRVAAIRFNAPTGIRYRTSVSGLYDTLVAALGAENVKLSTLIAPQLFVNDAGAFTKDALDALTNVNSDRYVEVPYTAEEWYESTSTTVYADYNITTGDALTFTGAVAEILEENYAVNYCGIGVLSYRTSADGEWTTVYADYAEVEGQTGIPAYSIQYLAECAVADTEAGYTTAQLEALQKYLPAEENS